MRIFCELCGIYCPILLFINVITCNSIIEEVRMPKAHSPGLMSGSSSCFLLASDVDPGNGRWEPRILFLPPITTSLATSGIWRTNQRTGALFLCICLSLALKWFFFLRWRKWIDRKTEPSESCGLWIRSRPAPVSTTVFHSPVMIPHSLVGLESPLTTLLLILVT